ncbi:MAG TPA: cell envelope integrity protein TolA [Steroidobacteraceae bacterium]|nr:cell envelope integrity protein TolA [Steroidobacteraceae bacterium]
MSRAGRQGIAPVGWSIALHAIIAGLLFLGLSMPLRNPDPQPMPLPIDAVVVDDAVIQAASNQRRDVERRRAEERRLELAAQEAAERERQEVERRTQEVERQAVEAEQRRQAEDAAERKARAEAEAKRKVDADAKRRAEQQAQAKAAADRKRAADEAKLREQRERDLNALLAAEDQRTGPAFQSLRDSYILAIQAHVEQRWYEPPGMPSGMSCTVFVTQIPGGEVVRTRFGACNGSAAVRQSIETAVRNASPLPAPREPALFAREVELVFTPKETGR